MIKVDDDDDDNDDDDDDNDRDHDDNDHYDNDVGSPPAPDHASHRSPPPHCSS